MAWVKATTKYQLIGSLSHDLQGFIHPRSQVVQDFFHQLDNMNIYIYSIPILMQPCCQDYGDYGRKKKPETNSSSHLPKSSHPQKGKQKSKMLVSVAEIFPYGIGGLGFPRLESAHLLETACDLDPATKSCFFLASVSREWNLPVPTKKNNFSPQFTRS